SGRGKDKKAGKENKDGQRGGSGRQAKSSKEENNKEKGQGKDSSSSSSRWTSVQQTLQRLGKWLKWIVFAVIAVLVVVALLRGGLGWLANFTDWARRLLEAWRRFWASLFGGSRKTSQEGEEEEVGEPTERSVPFSAFANPFENGRAERMTPRQLVRYSFEALEAWARER